jgi:hypothetical protein
MIQIYAEKLFDKSNIDFWLKKQFFEQTRIQKNCPYLTCLPQALRCTFTMLNHSLLFSLSLWFFAAPGVVS